MENNKSFRLPKKFTEQWLEALKSGEYKQIQSTLIKVEMTTDVAGNKELVSSDTKSCCCLGVAAVMLGAKDTELRDYGMPFEIKEEVCKRIGYPDELLQKAGKVPYTPLSSILAQMNDGLSKQDHEDYLKEYPNINMKHVPKEYMDLDEDEVITCKYSFEEIADFIKDNVELYEEDVKDEVI